jgi:hypothetical protein
VKTEIIQNIPIVIPSKDRRVRSWFTTNELKANRKLSNVRRRENILYNYDFLKIGIIPEGNTDQWIL